MTCSLLRRVGGWLHKGGDLLLDYAGDDVGDVQRHDKAHANFMLDFPSGAGIVSNRPLGTEREMHEAVVHVDRYRRVDESFALVTRVEDFDPSDLVICHFDFPPQPPACHVTFFDSLSVGNGGAA